MKVMIRKFLNMIRIRKFRNRILIVLIVMSVAPVLLLGLLSYHLANDALVENQTENNRSYLKTTSETSDIIFRNIINTERLILSNYGLRQELIQSGSSVTDEESAIGLETRVRLQSLLSSYLVDQRYLDSVCVIDNYFRSVCFGRSNTIDYFEEDPSKIAQTEWYERSVEAKGREIFLDHNVLENKDDTFSSVKLLLNPENFTHEPIGLLVVNIKKSMFSNTNEDVNGGLIIIDTTEDETRTVYDSRPSAERLTPANDLDATLKKLKDMGYILSHFKNKTTNWTFISAIEAEQLLKDSLQIRTATFSIAFIITLTVMVLSVIMSSKITSPLQQLKKVLTDWPSNIENNMSSANKDEFEVIEGTFKQIKTENRTLNEQLISAQLKGKEAELRALQAQINPHFLYNTLDSIYWMAMIENNDEIAKMAISLSESFKISLNQGKEMIPLYRELEHIHHYLAIQNIRFGNRFQYIEEVDEELMDKEILKLLLQPIIENAITHGLERKIGEGTVRLVGRMDALDMVFTVEDDGVGIKDMAETEKGFGLGNVRERLLLYYGTASSLTITSELNRGTVVEIRLSEQKGGILHAEGSHF